MLLRAQRDDTEASLLEETMARDERGGSLVLVDPRRSVAYFWHKHCLDYHGKRDLCQPILERVHA